PTPAVARIRAAFIRTEVMIYRLDPWDAARVQYEEGFGDRLDFKVAWSGSELDRLSGGFWFYGSFAVPRGVPSAVTVSPGRDVLKRPPDAFDQTTVEYMRFERDMPTPRQLAGAKWFPRLSGLGFYGGRYYPGQLAPILDHPPPGLTELSLGTRV